MSSSMYLGMVLPKVVAGGTSAKATGEEMTRVDADYRAVAAAFDRGDAEAGLRAFAEFEARYPPLADSLPAVSIKLHELLKQGDAGEGKRYAETLIAKAIEQHNAVLLEMAYGQLRTYRDSKEFLAVAVRAADALVRIDGGEQAPSLLYLADAHFRSGDKARAKGCARRAVDAAAGESPDFREYVEKEARRFGAGK